MEINKIRIDADRTPLKPSDLNISSDMNDGMNNIVDEIIEDAISTCNTPTDARDRFLANTYSLDIASNESDICRNCGGCCCKGYSGAYHPLDLGISKDDPDDVVMNKLEAIINPVIKDSPQISIDWYEGFVNPNGKEVKGFFIRPRHVGGDIVDPSYGEQCSNLTDSGCKLSWDQRPWICKALIPNTAHACHSGFDSKLEAAKAWYPWYHLLYDLYKKYDKGTHTGEPSPIMNLLNTIFGGE